jgi:hypothetical protein
VSHHRAKENAGDDDEATAATRTYREVVAAKERHRREVVHDVVALRYTLVVRVHHLQQTAGTRPRTDVRQST